MFRLPFAKRADDAGTGALRDADEMWALPDMEAAPPSEEMTSERRSGFQLEELDVHPAGRFEAELVSWRPLPNDRVGWGFRSAASMRAGERGGDQLDFVTGTVYRTDNHLCRLLTALGALAPQGAAEMEQPATRSALEQTLSQLDPGTLIGRRCRIEVGHERDELGNVIARVKSVAPMGQH